MPSRSTLTSARHAHRRQRARRARRRAIATTVAAGALGILVTTGFTAGPALAATASGSTWPAVPTALSGASPLTSITTEAAAALDDAETALRAADAATAEVTASALDLGDEPTAIDTAALRGAIESLSELDLLPILLVPDLADTLVGETSRVTAQVAELTERLESAREKKAQAEAQAEAEARAAAEAKAEAEAQAAREAEAAAALAAANTVEGAQATAQRLSAETYGWGADQFSCLVSLWNKESGWDYQAYNASSGATGIPQSLPGSKMATAGADWQTSATTQIVWGLGYISAAYGTPCAAWAHSQATNWY